MDSTLLILTSPPASGKTYWIQNFFLEIQKPILVISPLRALANECKEKWGTQVQVMTPEEWLYKKSFYEIVIFDEFHLLFYWGDSFRNMMWEAFYELSYNSSLIIGLTATYSLEMQGETKKFASHFDKIFWINHGNQCLKFAPERYIKVYSKKLMLKLCERQCRGVKLIFCAYRNEVDEVSRYLSKRGYKVWSCVGGEASKMNSYLKTGKAPDFIVSTTVLSHGVNLPEINEIYFLYQVKNLDFWIQMVARGGRRGQKYSVFAMENPNGISWNPLKNLFQLLLLHPELCFNLWKRQAQQWFLKV